VLKQKLLKQGYISHMLMSALYPFCGRNHELVVVMRYQFFKWQWILFLVHICVPSADTYTVLSDFFVITKCTFKEKERQIQKTYEMHTQTFCNTALKSHLKYTCLF